MPPNARPPLGPGGMMRHDSRVDMMGGGGGMPGMDRRGSMARPGGAGPLKTPPGKGPSAADLTRMGSMHTRGLAARGALWTPQARATSACVDNAMTVGIEGVLVGALGQTDGLSMGVTHTSRPGCGAGSMEN
jgi:hypothetical protein